MPCWRKEFEFGDGGYLGKFSRTALKFAAGKRDRAPAACPAVVV